MNWCNSLITPLGKPASPAAKLASEFAPLMILFKVFYLVTNSFIVSHFWEPFNIEFGIIPANMSCSACQALLYQCQHVSIALSKTLLSDLNKMYILQVNYGKHVSKELLFSY
ncbi:MAG: hypothetical protein QXH39_05555 [Conexivisphaerales archaeon]